MWEKITHIILLEKVGKKGITRERTELLNKGNGQRDKTGRAE